MTKNSEWDKDKNQVLSPADEAFLRLAEDSFEAAGQPKDQGAADRVWQKLGNSLADAAQPQVISIKARKRPFWLLAGGGLAAAAAVFLFLKPAQLEILPGKGDAVQTRSGAAGYEVTLRADEDNSSTQQRESAAATTSDLRPIVLKITANRNSYLSLWRQNLGAQPEIVQSLSYEVSVGELEIMRDQAALGTRYCILGAEDEEGLKHLTELILQIWDHLPASSCRTVS